MVARRILLRTACAAAIGTMARAQNQFIGPPPHEKGPKVFLDYDQVELDAAYNQAAYALNGQQVVARHAANSDLVRQRLGNPQRVAYGPTEIEKLDIYKTSRPNAPINIFIHGGAWRNGLAKDSGFPAELFVRAGAHYVVPDFVAVTDAGGSLPVMVNQVRRSIEWVSKNAASFGGDPKRIYLSGHSSGAHLAAAALLDSQAIQAALLVSGMYDLKGPRLSARSRYIKFDDETEDSLSPQRHLDRISIPLIVAYAGLDTPEFQRQSRDFAAALKSAGKPVDLIRGELYNHGEFIETLGNPYGILGRAVLRQMNVAG